MTFYLGNNDVRPVGAEAGEFIDDPILPDPSDRSDLSDDEGDEDEDDERDEAPHPR